MGNYRNLEIDFIERTLALINQYEDFKGRYEFDAQYNHTLLINCLLGLAILPKERVITYAPQQRMPILKALGNAGIQASTFDDTLVKTTKDLIIELRDSVAHSNINFISLTDSKLIDRIQFINDQKGVVVADFASEELLPFIRWFAVQLIQNLKRAQG